ncbi:triphosphoribosyl-dephospho-CoA synthase [Paraburkholderia heleia]|uniref:triphosphoribosyl-dephospho-CoA synthase n=1 Tax=Paraburkholderia heleia TaxID=634127 RepID=UPI00248022E4|nr:triphosphoribosyl-dephospho-CoA synthase [Paraburkholderia heleia]
MCPKIRKAKSAQTHTTARGAHGEAEDGFPHVMSVALRALREARRRGHDEDTARLDALLSVMSLDDMYLPHNGGSEASDPLAAARFLDRVERDSSLAIAVQSSEEVNDSRKHLATSTRASTLVDLAQLTTGTLF